MKTPRRKIGDVRGFHWPEGSRKKRNLEKIPSNPSRPWKADSADCLVWTKLKTEAWTQLPSLAKSTTTGTTVVQRPYWDDWSPPRGASRGSLTPQSATGQGLQIPLVFRVCDSVSWSWPKGQGALRVHDSGGLPRCGQVTKYLWQPVLYCGVVLGSFRSEGSRGSRFREDQSQG